MTLPRFKRSTVVYGNLGRQPKRLLEQLRDQYPSHLTYVTYKDDVDVTQHPKYNVDLLVWMEPPFHAVVKTPRCTDLMLVFTSHLLMDTDLDVVVYIEELLDRPLKRITCVEATGVTTDEMTKTTIVDRTHGVITLPEWARVTVVSTEPPEVVEENGVVVVDLTDDWVDPHVTYLCLLDVLDHGSLQRSTECLVCFQEEVLDDFLKCVAGCREMLNATRFESGNVTHKPFLASYFLLDMEYGLWEQSPLKIKYGT